MSSMITTVRVAVVGSAVAAAVAFGGVVTAPTAAAQPGHTAPAHSTAVAKGVRVSPSAINNLGLTSAEAKRVQLSLYDCGYIGKVDGLLGPLSWKAMQTCLIPYGYSGSIDGIVGPRTISALQYLLKQHGWYSGAIDGIAGPKTRAGFKKFANWI